MITLEDFILSKPFGKRFSLSVGDIAVGEDR